jgi:hypothetical protein
VPRYYLRDSTGGVSGEDWGLLISTGTAGSPQAKAVAIGGSPDTNTNYGTSAASDPGTTSWDGTYTVTVDVSTGVNKTFGEIRLVRYNSGLTEQEEKTSTEGSQEWEFAQTYTYTFSSTTWSSPAAGDRLALRFISSNTNHAGQTHYVDTEDTYVDTPYAIELAGTSAGAGSITTVPLEVERELAGSSAGASTVSGALLSNERLFISGAETGSITQECVARSGTHSYSSTVHRTGQYSFRTNPTGSGTGYFSFARNADGGEWDNLDSPTLFIHFGFRCDTAPSANDEPIAAIRHGATNAELRLNSSRYLVLYDKDGSLVETGTTQLSLNTWYSVEWDFETGTTAAYAVRLDGSSELSGTGNFLTTNPISFYIGKWASRNNETVDFYFDDIVIDKNYAIGDSYVVPLYPNADGTQTGWTASAGNKWDCVEEVPLTTGTYIYTSTTDDVYSADFEGSTDVGLQGNIKSVTLYAAGQEGSPATTDLSVRIYSGSGNVESIGLDLASASWKTCWYIAETDPDTSSAWTSGAIDSIEGAVVCGNNNAQHEVAQLLYFVEADAPPEIEIAGQSDGVSTVSGTLRVVSVVNFCGWESQALGTSGEGSFSTGTLEINTTTKKTGAAALRTNPGTASLGYERHTGIAADGSPASFNLDRIYYQVDLKPVTASSTSYAGLLRFRTITPNTVFNVLLDNNRNLQVYDDAGYLDTGSTTISDQWWGIRVTFGIGTSETYEVQINDGTGWVTESSGSCNTGSTNVGYVELGKSFNYNSNALDYYFDNQIVTTEGWTDADAVKQIVPNADGNYEDAGWTGTPDNTDKYSNWDETPSDYGTSYNYATTAGEALTSDLQSLADAGINTDTLRAVKAYVVTHSSTSTSGVRVRVRSGTTDSDTTTNSKTTTWSALVNVIEKDPDTSGTWSRSAIDALEVGVVKQDPSNQQETSKAAVFVLYKEELGGQSDGQSGISADLTVVQGDITLEGQSDGASGITAVLEVEREIAGQSDGQSSIAALLGLSHELAGQADGQSSITDADLSVSADVLLAGQSDGQSGISALLGLAHDLAGQSDGQSGISALLGLAYDLTGQSDGQSAITALLGLAHDLAGQSDGQSAIAALLGFAIDLAGQSDGQSANTAAIEAERELAGQSDGQSAIGNALLDAQPALAGQSDGACTITNADLAVVGQVALEGQSDASSGTSADLQVVYEISGQSDGQSTIAALLGIAHDLAGQTDGQSANTAALQVAYEIAGQSDGQSGITADLQVAYEIAGQSDGDHGGSTGRLRDRRPVRRPVIYHERRSDH